MANKVALIHSSIWEDDDFLARTAAAQRLYLLLVSQKDISLCGLVLMAPNRWAQLAADTKAPAITKALRELERARFVISDQSCDEVLIRTYPRHAGTLKQPNVIIGMTKQYALIRSPRLRSVVIDELPPTALDPIPEPLRKNIAEPFHADFRKAKENPSGDPFGGRVRGKASPEPFGEEMCRPLDRLSAGPVVESVGTSTVVPLAGSDPGPAQRPRPAWAKTRSAS